MSDSELPIADDLFVNFCDYDANWGPILFLRPERNASIGLSRWLAAAVLVGVPLGLFGSIVVSLIARSLEKPIPPVLAFPLALTAIYFVIGRFTIVRAWNRRATRLAQLRR